MFLNFLTSAEEQEFFLEFAYLLAVAEQESSRDQIPTFSWVDDPENGRYAYAEFAPGFAMKTSELLMIRKFAEEMGKSWDPVSSGFITSHFEWVDMPTWGSGMIDMGSGMVVSSDMLKKVARRSSVADMLEVSTNKLVNYDRSAVLKFVLTVLMIRAQVSSFSMAVKKAVLFEAVAMACADDTLSKYEEELLLYFCEFCHLDKEYISEFQVITSEFQAITKKFSTLHAESIELITE